MKFCRRALCVAAILVAGGGCSGYRTAWLPRDSGFFDEIEKTIPVSPGDRVRITLETGATGEGIVANASSVTLTVVSTTDPADTLAIAADEIHRLEVQVSKPAVADLGAAALAVGGVVGGYFLIHADGDKGVIRDLAR